jgi:hypothetical protein
MLLFNLLGYFHNQVIVERTKGVMDHLIIVGIILPFPIDEKLILVPSRGESDNLGPPPFVVLFHRVLLEIPTVEVPNQDGLFGFRCLQLEGNPSFLYLLAALFSGHFSSSSAFFYCSSNSQPYWIVFLLNG